MLKLDILEDKDSMIDHFTRSLHKDIEHELAFQKHHSLEEAIHKMTLIKQQLAQRRSRNTMSYQSALPPLIRDFKPPPPMDNKPKVIPKIEKPKTKAFKQPNPKKQKASNIGYFKYNCREHIAPQCPNKRHLIIRANGDIRRIKA